ncbi:MAG: DMT family transporter [Pseudomonadota bacterium]
MRLILLTTLTMVAFAANSVLNRLALADGAIGPAEFAGVRVVAGAVTLMILAGRAGPTALSEWRVRIVPTLALVLYLITFSAAYIALDAGAGALILFGAVQVTMFGGALVAGERVERVRWAGAALALGGLAWLLWPGGTAPPLGWSAMMGVAGIGWGIYSLWGKKGGPPLPATAANFTLAVPLTLLVAAFLIGPRIVAEPWGIALAILSGAVTSGLGYALWYTVLPSLGAVVAALVQLSVPVIAMAGGMVFLGEALTLRFVLASTLVIGGIALGVLGNQRWMGSKGS